MLQQKYYVGKIFGITTIKEEKNNNVRKLMVANYAWSYLENLWPKNRKNTVGDR
jgi:hypothetical protein